MALQYCCTRVPFSIKVGVKISTFCLGRYFKNKTFFPTYGCGRIMKSGKISVNYVISYMVSQFSAVLESIFIPVLKRF
jgi:hypothetical protein